jgi:ribosome-associated protein
LLGGGAGLCYNLSERRLPGEVQRLEGIDVARRAVEAASDRQASDIVLLDARSVCSFADYFVICSGDSERQLHAIYDEVEHALKEAGETPHHAEGSLESGWLLLDYGDVIVHIFGAREREYYCLDELWRGARLVLRMP